MYGMFPFAAMTIIIQLVFIIWPDVFPWTKFTVLWVYGMVGGFILSLQLANEMIQYSNPGRDTEYGSEENFLLESMRNWKKVMQGLIYAIIFNLLVQGVLYGG